MINVNEERLVRKVTQIGNGAHIFAPKEWLGEDVIIIRNLISLKDKIFSLLEENLEHIKGLYLYGSRARGEAESGSDIDLFIIADRKIKIKTEGYEIISLMEEEIDKAIKISPVLIYGIFSEAKPIINSSLLKELRKKYSPELNKFKQYIVETKNLLKAYKGLIKEKKNLMGVAYSLILRLKGIYIIKMLISGRRYMNKDFELWLKKELPDIDLASIIKAYKSIKRNENKKISLNPAELNNLISLLNKELMVYEKKKTA